MDETGGAGADDRLLRERAERTAHVVFGVGALSTAIVCGAVVVSGWFAGVITDSYERVFWTGAVLAGVMNVVLAAAVWPGGADDRRVARRTAVLVRVGLALFVTAPALCIGALVADFFL
jgi:hypothetical protein